MLAIRLLGFAAAAILVTSASAQTVIPYTGVGIGGSNNVYDQDLRMCGLDPNQVAGLGFGLSTGQVEMGVGCIDRLWAQCSATPSAPCQIRSIPEGRCAAGVGACLWNDPNNIASFRCDANIGIQCIGDADCPPGDTCDTDNSAGNGNDPNAVSACACTSATEQSVCGPDHQARCSDGDPALAYGNVGGGGCGHLIVSGMSEPSGCGKEAGQALTGTRKPGWENAPSAITPQRRVGLGLSSVGEILELQGAGGLILGDADPNHGIRRYEFVGKVSFSDWGFGEGDVGGSSVDAVSGPTPGDPPLGWGTENLIGTCSAGSKTGTLCLIDVNCTGGGAGSCANKMGAYRTAGSEIGFIFTETVTDTSGICPPDCGLDYDHHTYEQQMIEAVNGMDVEAGVQLSLDSLRNAPGRPQLESGYRPRDRLHERQRRVLAQQRPSLHHRR